MGNTQAIRIPELTGWRGIFILMIFFHHVDLFPAGGTTGVAFFFLLGGFAMALGYSEKVLSPDFKYGGYFWKRATKFYPIHWLLLFMFLILNILCSVPVGLKTFVPNFLLIQSFIPDRDFFYAYNSPSWYLCDTLFFAAIFPFIIRGINKLKNSLWFRLLAILLFVTYVVVEVSVPEEQKLAIIYINPLLRAFDYLVGIAAGLWLLHYLKKGRTYIKKSMIIIGLVLSALLLTGVIALPAEARLYSSVYWIPIVGLLIFTALLSTVGGGSRFLKSKLLVSFGEVSFAFYMIHSFCIDIVRVAFSKLGFDNLTLSVCCALLLTVVGSYIATYFFINPIGNWLIKTNK